MSWTSPLLLLALGLLPLLWWLMQLLPPAPQRIVFPALSLLPQQTQITAQNRLPWWLMALRVLLAACMILGLAGPSCRNTAVSTPALRQTIIVDTGWTAATRFAELRSLAAKAINQNSQSGSQIRLISTAASPAAQRLAASEWLSPALARQRLRTLEPMAWGGDRSAITALPALGDTTLISDGLDPASARTLIAWAKTAGRVRVMAASKQSPAQIRRVRMTTAGLQVDVAQAASAQPRSLIVTAHQRDGSRVSMATAVFAAGKTAATVLIPLAPGARVRIAQLRITGETSSGGVYLLDASKARPYVGLASREGDTPVPLRSADFYLQRALQTHADVTRGDMDALLARGINMLLLPDYLPEQPTQRARLEQWVASGGVLLLFAGPRSQSLSNPLLPVALRPTTRSISGAMRWGKPASLGPWPEASPFAGLPIPPDITISQQWLAEPGTATATQSWARLTDSTPLVSAQSRGRGMIILFHTSANAAWSTLVLSGLFEQMLVRLLPFAAAMNDAGAPEAIRYQLEEAMNGYGELHPASTSLSVTALRLQHAQKASAAMPPGLYAAAGRTAVLNTGGTIPDWISQYDGAQQVEANNTSAVLFDGRPWLLAIALLLLLLDGLITLFLKGLLRWPLVLAALLLPVTAANAAPDGAFDVQLCAVRGVADNDALAGLQNLGTALKRRTAIVPGNAALISLQQRDLGLCTMLYWPITDATPMLNAATAQRVQRYMAQGGLLLIDSGWSSQGTVTLRRVLAALPLPRLEPLSAGHVMAKSFYLLERAPGGFDFSSLWLEANTLGASGNTSDIIISQARLAAAWHSADPQTQERALRLGINAVIYALTGTYKADQVHAAGLLERMARPAK
jgi:hypothetical protein